VTWRFLLDTNVLSEPIRSRPNPGIMKGIQQHELEITTAAPVLHEIIFGYALLPASRKRMDLERYVREVVETTLPVLPYDAACAAWHGRERARLVGLGKTPPFVDGQIAAIARLNDLEVVTTNPDDFRAFEGIRIADWRA
jgi:tRNA(fMet)-specific endonuclease VapC